jgi:hypothetical protein
MLLEQELAEHSSEHLPDREAMSLMTTGVGSLVSGYEDLGVGETAPSGGESAQTAAGTATEAHGATEDAAAISGTDADASATETASITDSDRSETYHQTDSAVSQT